MKSEKKTGARPEWAFLSFARMLWKQKIFVALVWILASASAIAIVYSIPVTYKAETLVLVESQKIPEALVTSTVNAELQDRLATISQQILSSTRLQKIIDKFDLYRSERRTMTREEVIEQMRKDIKVKLEKGWTRNQPGAFRISYVGLSPEVTAAVANDVSNLFIEENLRTREMQASGTSEFIENQLSQAKKSLEEQEAALAKYKQEHNGELPEQENALLTEMDQYKVQLQGNQEAMNRLQQSKMLLQSELDTAELTRANLVRSAEQAANMPASAGPTGNGGPGGQAAPKRSDTIRRQLDDAKLRYTAQHPVIKEMQAALAQAEKDEAVQAAAAQAAAEAARIAAAKNASQAAGVKIERPMSPEMAKLLASEQERITNIRTQMAIADKELAGRQADQERILKGIEEARARVGQLPIRQQEMEKLLRDYDISREYYKSLLNKNYAAEIAADMEKRQKAERFTVLDSARVPEKPYQPNRPVFIAVGCMISLILAIAFGVSRELRKNVILGEWELPQNLTVLGRIPAIDSVDEAANPFHATTAALRKIAIGRT
jgi:polysaccharide chain length determinant protein (PEP-CTERM system associated)